MTIYWPQDVKGLAVEAVAVIPGGHSNAKHLNYPRDQVAVLMISAAQVHARANRGVKRVSDCSLHFNTIKGPFWGLFTALRKRSLS